MTSAGRLQVESPRGLHALVPPPDQLSLPLADLLRRANLPLNTRCGQRGLCDGCLIELLDGELIHVHTNQPVRSPSTVRGCEHRLPLGGSISIRIPQRSALGYEPCVLSDFRLNVPFSHCPLVKPNPGQPTLGAAVDIGTTTVVVLLVDLHNARIVARAGAFNEQMHLGDDVLTRINLCSHDPSMLQQLHDAVAQRTIRPLLLDALRQAKATVEQLACMSIAGNTTMLHLLAKVDPTPMGVAPFTPAFLDHRILPGQEVFAGEPRINAPCHLLPGAAAYIGADLTAGAVASGLVYDEGPCLLVDVGTNGEIILKHAGKLIGCATAAGPAFEGAGLSSGMRAGAGAIEHIHIDEALNFHTELIGDEGAKPVGLCGSAYIDLLAEGRRVGLLNSAGRFDSAAPTALRDRITTLDTRDLAFVIDHAPGRQPITVTQRDIARLLQAKAAVAAGMLTLLDRAGLAPRDVKTLYLAGGFGTHMNAAHAIAAGLVPGFVTQQVQPVGNTSLGGAFLALMDAGALDEIAHAARSIQVVELNHEPTFESHYIDQIGLP